MQQQPQSARFLGSAWLPLALATGFVVLALRDSFAEMLRQWIGSPTYSHGVLVAPIAGWLAWRSRAAWSVGATGSRLPGIAMLFVALALWVVARRARLDALEQIGAVAALIGALTAMLGHARARHLAFALGFLLFMVPFGEEIVPALMRITADVATLGVRAFGIPVYRDGMLISLPGGDFEVVRACSGIRYLITAMVVGALFSYLTFESWRRRVAFMLCCFLGSIAANGLRALIVILAAHWSNYRIGVGVDHIFFGWIWFGGVMLLMMILGARYSDRSVRTDGGAVDRSPRLEPLPVGPPVVVAGLLGLAALVDAKPAEPSGQLAHLAAPAGATGWTTVPASSDWEDGFADADARIAVGYRSAAGDVDLRIARYVAQRPTHEAADGTHDVFDPFAWALTDRVRHRVGFGSSGSLSVARSLIRAGEKRRVVWHWYRQGDVRSASRLAFKLRSGLAAVRGDASPADAVMLSTEIRLTADEADGLLAQFLVTHFDALERCAGDTVAERDPCLVLPGTAGVPK